MKPLDIDYDVNWRSRALKAEAQVTALQAEIERLVSALDGSMCPRCDQTIRHGHAPDCPDFAGDLEAVKQRASVAEKDWQEAEVQVTALRALLREMDEDLIDYLSGDVDRTARGVMQQLVQQIRAVLGKPND